MYNLFNCMNNCYRIFVERAKAFEQIINDLGREMIEIKLAPEKNHVVTKAESINRKRAVKNMDHPYAH